MYAIKTEKLTKYYGKARGIVDLDLAVGAGEYFGFIGPNGAGKSTTIRSLLGLIRPTSGDACVLGLDAVRDSVEIRRRVGYLPSEASLYPGMKVRDVLKMSADLRKLDCSAESARLCKRLDLDVSKKVDELSFGNRKKVAIVCALQCEPELLVLDEPTGGLDPLMQKEFFELVGELNKKGTTVFMSSHVLHEVQKNCERAAVIREGRIIACGSVGELSGTGAKRVTVRGKIDLALLGEVKDLRLEEGGESFLYGGDTNRLIAALSAGKVSDFTVTEPDLDEIFLHFYEKEGAEK